MLFYEAAALQQHIEVRSSVFSSYTIILPYDFYTCNYMKSCHTYNDSRLNQFKRGCHSYKSEKLMHLAPHIMTVSLIGGFLFACLQAYFAHLDSLCLLCVGLLTA